MFEAIFFKSFTLTHFQSHLLQGLHMGSFSKPSAANDLLTVDSCLKSSDVQGADNKLGQFLIQDIYATANHRNCLRHSLESCPSLV